MMRILIASDQYPPSIGGVEQATINLVQALVAMGHDVAVIAPNNSMWKNCPTHEYGVSTLRVRSWPIPVVPGLRFSRHTYKVIHAFIDDFTPDIIQLSSPYGLCRAISAYARRSNTPLISVSHTMPEAHLFFLLPFKQLLPVAKHWYWRWVMHRFREARIIVSPSATATKQLIGAGQAAKKTATISNGLELSTPHANTSPSAMRKAMGIPERFTLIYLGRISIEKRVNEIVTALSQLPAGCNIQLILVGAGKYLPQLLKQITVAGLEQKVIVKGWTSDRDEKFGYLAAADAFVTASPMESQGIAVLEAMAVGKAIIAPRAGALPELVHSGRNGELYQSGNAKALAAAIKKLAHDPLLTKQYGAASMELVAMHDFRKTILQYIDLYKRTIDASEISRS